MDLDEQSSFQMLATNAVVVSAHSIDQFLRGGRADNIWWRGWLAWLTPIGTADCR